MKLSINLDSREEIAAAVPLLKLILDNTPKTCGGQCHGHADGVSGSATTTPVVAEISQDPAAVFGGGAQPAAPLPPAGALSIAGAVPSPIAPEATTAITSCATLSAPVPSVPAAPVMVAPTVSGAAPSTPASFVELDKNGLPWDERIHASTKTKIASGEWKAKRGVEPALVAQVEAELRARAATSPAAVPAVPAAPVAPAAPVVDPAAVFGGAAPATPTVPPVAPLAPAATVAPSVSADPMTFEQLMPRLTAAVTTGIMPPTAVGAACATHGIASVVALQQSPQFVPHVWATLKQQYPEI